MFGKKVGISISDPEINELKSSGQNKVHLSKLSQYVANYVLGRGATLIYGGDLLERMGIQSNCCRKRRY